MRLTYNYRLFPTAAHRTALERTLGICRWVYNKTFAVRKEAWEERGDSLARYDTIHLLPVWKADPPWLKDAYSQTVQDAGTRVELACHAFFRRVQAGEEPGYPRCKGKGWYKSFPFPQAGVGWKRLDDGRLRLSKSGDVKIRWHRPSVGQAKTLIIKRDSLGNGYACCSVDVAPEPLEPSPHGVGMDLGLSPFATLSTGEQVPNARFFRHAEQDLAKAQRKLSACETGTPESRKARRVVQHNHRPGATRRQDVAHKLSRVLVDTFPLIAFEDLHPAKRVNLRSLAKSISDAAWIQLHPEGTRYTTYQADYAGRTVVLVDPRYPSQECAGCGARVKKELSVRVHLCPRCGLELDRDLNAALHGLARGLACLGSNP